MTRKLPNIIRHAWGSDGVHRGDGGKSRLFTRTRYSQKSAGARLCGAIKTCLAAGLIAASLASLPQAGASPLAMPERGVILTGAEKQTYIANKMQAFFRPQSTASAQPFAAPDGWTWAHESIGGIRVEHMRAASKETNRVILQLHGGGYVLGMSDAHRLLALRQAVRTRAAEVYAVDYRLAPTHVYPAALEDAAAVYQGLLSRGVKPWNIILVGDSAGGNLALELALHLREQKIPLPSVIALASPWATLEHAENTSRTAKAAEDMVLGIGTPLYDAVKTPAYAGTLDRKDPRLSPVYADLTGLPPLLIQTGGNELFLTENQKLAEKAAADGVPVMLSIYPGMPHDFALLLPEMEESIQSILEIADFMNRCMN